MRLCAVWVVFLFDVIYYAFGIHYDAVELSEAGFPRADIQGCAIFGALGTVEVISMWFLGGVLSIAFSSLRLFKVCRCLRGRETSMTFRRCGKMMKANEFMTFCLALHAQA